MPAGLLIRLRPSGPWRIGPDSGARDRVDHIYHSDTLFSAVTHALSRLGWMEDWLAETVRSETGPAVRLTSMFPWQMDWLYMVPPRNLWPPPFFFKLRAQGARFVPADLVSRLLSHQHIDEDAWAVDGHSECLVPRAKTAPSGGPFRVALRNGAAVDRLAPGIMGLHQTACLEFAPGAGLWCAAVFRDESAAAVWKDRVLAAFKLLADSGFGGRRSSGWGQCELDGVREGELADMLLPGLTAPPGPTAAQSATDEPPAAPLETFHWLLSLFNPGDGDTVDWQRGSYRLVERCGRIESSRSSGEVKKSVRMVVEGSVLAAAAPPSGRAIDVAPEGFPHPVFRSGFAVSLPVQGRAG